MANHKSAKKRAKQNVIRRMRNNSVRTRIRNAVNNFQMEAGNGSPEAAAGLDEIKSLIDKAAKKGVYHKKNASRKISRLSKLVNRVSA
ncbi:MAG: 30S ribosomal protein S20 [Desulfobacterales bacterium]|nr:30S ribosomal protein S20 [Desulfobacteraceae bacterium]MBT4364018.1 30S ribosomal protein S20 [Desulfobacteraceae bacterium]MBT7086934.1 30S ribosomal protein S20 [Desulfobacterales bacterium]MBT7696069.1 30S ribosomal protein S20 [Desulfobacterales bacterium]